MDAPRVTVLMPVFDADATLDDAIESVRAQTLPAWELVAVDDGSTDGSLERLRDHAARDGRVRVVAAGRRGIVGALNAGLDAARAPWVARMDADDEMLPDRLAAQLALAEARPELGVVGCRVRAFPDGSVTDGMRHYLAWMDGVIEPADFVREMWVESPLAHPSVTFRRDVVRAAGGYRDGPFPEDYDLWLRLHGAGVAMAKVPRVLLRWREGPGRLSRRDPRYSQDAFRALKAAHLARRLGDRREVRIWGAGPDGRRWRRALAAEGVRVACFYDIDPRKIGRVLGDGVPVLDARGAAEARDPLLLCAVGVKGARALIRAALDGAGMREGTDYLCVQ